MIPYMPPENTAAPAHMSSTRFVLELNCGAEHNEYDGASESVGGIGESESRKNPHISSASAVHHASMCHV